MLHRKVAETKIPCFYGTSFVLYKKVSDIQMNIKTQNLKRIGFLVKRIAFACITTNMISQDFVCVKLGSTDGQCRHLSPHLAVQAVMMQTLPVTCRNVTLAPR